MYSHKMEKFDFEESRQMLALVDYPYLIKNKKKNTTIHNIAE